VARGDERVEAAIGKPARDQHTGATRAGRPVCRGRQ
jgi:hypothetical protein